MDNRVLVTVAGADTPGITASLAAVIAKANVPLLDVEQVVVHGQLTLCLLLDTEAGPDTQSVLKDLLFAAKEMGLDMHFQVVEKPPTEAEETRYAVTALGNNIGASGLAMVAETLASHEANIESIRKLSDTHFTAMEIMCSLPTERAKDLRRALIEAANNSPIDVAVQRESLSRRAKRVIVMDMDSTLIQIEVIDELARAYGVVDKVKAITEEAMEGNLDFEESLRKRVGLLKGMPEKEVMALADRLPLTDGASDLLRVLRQLGYKTGVISGGFTFAANTLKNRLGLDYAYANELEIKNGVVTGEVIDPIVTPQRKADLLRTIAQSEGVGIEQTIAIGDGANDMTMLQTAGLGIAYRAKAKLRAAADTAINTGGLDRILYLLGFHWRDVADLTE